MQTINILVVDFVGRETSRFIGDLNEHFSELPKDTGRKHSRKTQLMSLLENWEKSARVKIDDTLDLAINLVPLFLDSHPEKPENIWEVMAERAIGYTVLVANDKKTWDDCAKIIKQFRDYSPVPSIVVVYDHPLKDVNASQIRQGLDVDEKTPVFAYKDVHRVTLEDILKGLLTRITDDMA